MHLLGLHTMIKGWVSVHHGPSTSHGKQSGAVLISSPLVVQLEAVTLSFNQGQGCKNIVLSVIIIKCSSRGQEGSQSLLSKYL